jgi:predicted RNase H-like HicB family nuclease
MKYLTAELVPYPKFCGYTACVQHIPAYGEGETQEAAIGDLKEAIAVYLEDFGLEYAISRLSPRNSLRQLYLGMED